VGCSHKTSDFIADTLDGWWMGLAPKIGKALTRSVEIGQRAGKQWHTHTVPEAHRIGTYLSTQWLLFDGMLGDIQ